MTDSVASARTEPAGIEYHGISGISKACKEAVVNLIQTGARITAAKLVTANTKHALILSVGAGDLVAVKSGFASGYGGEAPSALSFTLALLDAHGVDISEHEVALEFIEALDGSALTSRDLESLDRERPVQGRWVDYVQERHWNAANEGTLWEEFPAVIPFAIIDPRMVDLARSFWENPDAAILTAYRRLEGVVRQRVGSDEHGARLFTQAFQPSGGKLRWDGIGEAERGARIQLFASVYTAFRNARAHQEREERSDIQLAEFLLVNQLYRLEDAALTAPPC